MKAHRLFMRGCEQGNDPRACFGAGFMSFSGYGTHKRDLHAALRLWERSCEAGFAHACHWFARTHTLGLAAARARAAGEAFDVDQSTSHSDPEHEASPATAFEGELIPKQLFAFIQDEPPSVLFLIYTIRFVSYNFFRFELVTVHCSFVYLCRV